MRSYLRIDSFSLLLEFQLRGLSVFNLNIGFNNSPVKMRVHVLDVVLDGLGQVWGTCLRDFGGGVWDSFERFLENAGGLGEAFWDGFGRLKKLVRHQ